MPDRTPLIAANWKMHAPPQGWDAEDGPYRPQAGVDVVVFPTFLDIPTCLEKFLVVGAQYGRPEPSGAYTGDISMQLIASHGCKYVLCGHSERRLYHGETDAFVAEQARAAAQAGLTPIVCVGETQAEREKGETKNVLKRQLKDIALPAVVAYEPLWAIGTGNAATGIQAQEMHAYIRSLLPAKEGKTTRILYGGSAKPGNAADFLGQPDVDGLLVGGASLDPVGFQAIVRAAQK